MHSNFIDQAWRYFMMPWRGISFSYGARRTRKWMKKNDKLQDSNHHDFEKRWNYTIKKSNTFMKLLGIKVVDVNEDYKPKGSFMLVANHVSNFDPFYILSSISKEVPATAIAKSTLQHSKIKGYFQATESFYVYDKNPRKSLNNFNNAGKWAKKNNRGVVIFPEGKRNWDGELGEFSAASFKLSQKYYLPIHPVSIVGSVEARKWYSFNTRTVKLIYHKPIKASEASKLTTIKLADKVKALIKADLDAYEKTFTGKELEKRNEYKERLRKKQAKFLEKFEVKEQKLIDKEEKQKAKKEAKVTKTKKSLRSKK